MRKNNAKKSIVTSFKVSPELNEVIEKAAEDKGISKSQYITECIEHRSNSLTPEILCRIENILGQCKRISDDNDILNNITKEIDELWGFLK